MLGSKIIINLWSGYHSSEFSELFNRCRLRGELLIPCPPKWQDFSYFKSLFHPQVEIKWHGGLKNQVPSTHATHKQLPEAQVEILRKACLGIFSSGSSGSGGRLVLYSEHNLKAALSSIYQELFSSLALKKIFCFPQPYHVFGLILGYEAARVFRYDLHTAFGPYGATQRRAWLDCLDQKTLTLLTPTHLRDLIQEHLASHLRPPPSLSCIIGGAFVSKEDWELAKSILNIAKPSIGYGCTEASPGITHLAPGVCPREDGDIGQVLRGVKLNFTKDGSYIFNGPNLCHAYLEGNDWTQPLSFEVADRLISNDGGGFTFLGRNDQLINRGAQKFDPELVDQNIFKNFGVPSVTFATLDKRLGQDLGVLILEDRGLEKTEILRFFKEFYSLNLKETQISFVKNLPFLPSSKVNRKAAESIWKSLNPLSLESLENTDE